MLTLAVSVLVSEADGRFSMTYSAAKMAEMVTKRTTATDRITRHMHERDVRLRELNETPTSVSNFCIFRTKESCAVPVTSRLATAAFTLYLITCPYDSLLTV